MLLLGESGTGKALAAKAEHRGSRRALAEELGVSERTLYRRLKKLARS